MRLFDVTKTMLVPDCDLTFPSSLAITTGAAFDIAEGDSAIGYCTRGGAVTVGQKVGGDTVGRRTLTLPDDGVFSIPGPARFEGVHAVMGIRHGFRGLALVGLLERSGRLPYIDGCSDTLLIAPPVLGDPCLNYLHMPAGTRQSMHHHPSVRIGLIVGGHGWCVSPSQLGSAEHQGLTRNNAENSVVRQGLTRNNAESSVEHQGLTRNNAENSVERQGLTRNNAERLSADTAFILEPGEQHCFHTDDEAMHIVVYHPESDFGPTPHDHPMINKTLLAKGRAARTA